MPTKLDRLIESIDPTRTVDDVTVRIDEAVNSFRLDRPQIDRWDDFSACLARFFRHVEDHALRARKPLPVNLEMDGSRCMHALRQVFGPNGDKAAFEMARTGLDGGLRAVLQAVASRMAEQYAGNETAAKIAQYWDELTVDEQLAAVREYIDKHGHLLPSELTEGSAGRIFGSFPKVLEQHPQLVRRLRDVGR